MLLELLLIGSFVFNVVDVGFGSNIFNSLTLTRSRCGGC